MGMETVAAMVIMIGGLMYFSSVMATTNVNSWTNMHESMIKHQEYQQDKLNEIIEVQAVEYDNAVNTTTLSIKNTGKKITSLTEIDIYINDLRIPRIVANRTITMNATSEIKNSGLWDPEELMTIEVYKHLNNGKYLFEIYSGVGNYDVYSIDVNN